MNGEQTPAPVVVLLHGMGRTPASFWRMWAALRAAGYSVKAIAHTLRRGTPEELAEEISHELPDSGVLSFVGHSLGGLIAMHLCRALPPERRGRIVQLGTPNLGSEAAVRSRPLAPILGPVLETLEPHDHPVVPPCELLAIAGSAAPEALSRVTGIEGKNDGLVSVASAHAAALPCNRLTLPVTHTLMMMDRRVIDATIDFLTDGKLDPQRVAEGYE